MDLENTLLYNKIVDKSVLTEGFTIPTYLVSNFTGICGNLNIGEKIEITLIIYDKEFKVQFINQKFDRNKYKQHKELYQIRYKKNGELSALLKSVFHSTSKFYQDQEAAHKQSGDNKKKIIKVPESETEYLALYATQNKFTWKLEPVTRDDISELKSELKQTPEVLYEDLYKQDITAHIKIQERSVKIRHLDRKVIDSLKELYNYKCQICNTQVGEPYGATVCEAHHIHSFVESVNNNYDNIIIVCPNHHRILHAGKATYIKKKEPHFKFENGAVLKLMLNMHL